MDKDKLNIISPFGPSIVKVKIPEKIIKSSHDHDHSKDKKTTSPKKKAKSEGKKPNKIHQNQAKS